MSGEEAELLEKSSFWSEDKFFAFQFLNYNSKMQKLETADTGQ